METWLLSYGTPSPLLDKALSHPGFTTIAPSAAWKRVQAEDRSWDLDDFFGPYFAKAASYGKNVAPRVVAGSFTPSVHLGPTFVPNHGPAAGKVCPLPVEADGTPNEALFEGLAELDGQLSKYLLPKPNVRLVHLTWPGGGAAEIFLTEQMLDVLRAKGLTNPAPYIRRAYDERLTMAHSLAVGPLELPVSGLEPIPEYRELQDSVLSRMARVNADRVMYTQRNGFSDGGGTGAWAGPAEVPHGLQMVKAVNPGTGAPFDWAKVYAKAKVSGADYLEVYTDSLKYSNATQLLQEADKAVNW